jgi:hypothetical protein
MLARTVASMATLPRVLANPAVHTHAAASIPTTPLRRCNFRYVKVEANGRGLPVYDVACTFPDRERRIPLGDLESAHPICASCTYPGIFRADED